VLEQPEFLVEKAETLKETQSNVANESQKQLQDICKGPSPLQNFNWGAEGFLRCTQETSFGLLSIGAAVSVHHKKPFLEHPWYCPIFKEEISEKEYSVLS